jgi:hypothetical protein
MYELRKMIQKGQIETKMDKGTVVSQNSPTGVDRQHKSREAQSLYPSAL